MVLAGESEEEDDDDGAGDAVYSKHRAGAMATFPFRAVEAVLMTVPALPPPPPPPPAISVVFILSAPSDRVGR